MKKVIIAGVFVAMVLTGCSVQSPYAEFREDNSEEITFTLSASSFLTHLFIDKDDVQEIKSIVKGIKRYRILVSEDNADVLEKRFKQLVNSGSYDELLHVKENGESVQLFLYRKGNKIKEILCKVKDNDDFVVLSVEGNLKIKDLNNLLDVALND